MITIKQTDYEFLVILFFDNSMLEGDYHLCRDYQDVKDVITHSYNIEELYPCECLVFSQDNDFYNYCAMQPWPDRVKFLLDVQNSIVFSPEK